ncbi:glycoside hydrolase superfamily [Parasitella parasitica]|nr:glycoside hydrolase superfamily [Parasitella parasitica]
MATIDASEELILSPDLSSSIIIDQRNKAFITFYCYSSVERRIELWTNLSQNGRWTGIPFTQQHNSPNEYTLQMNTCQLPPGKYEFTMRYSTALLKLETNSVPDCWFWYGRPNQNGAIHIVQQKNATPTAPSFAKVPQLCFVAKEHDSLVNLWHFRTRTEQKMPFSLGKLQHPMHRYVCLIQKGSTWITPVTGANNFQGRNISEKCQLLLYQDAENGDIHLWIVLCQYADCYLSFEPNDSINFHHKPGKDAHLLIASTSNRRHFAQLIQTAHDYYQNSIKQERSATVANSPMLASDNILLEKLGYCTWNAFGQNVDIAKVKLALDSLKAHDIPVGYLMIDDGWQSVTEKRQMAGFDACPSKFPGGLARIVAQLKADYTFIECIGVWHALWGYWNGIDQRFAEKNNYNWSFNRQNHEQVGIIENPKAFYNDFYKFLNESGIDFVKVDNQGSFQELSDTKDEQNISLWDDFRQAMVNSGDTFLQSQVLHCMSLTPHALYDPILSQKRQSIFRNSDDFFPDENDSHAWHIYANVMNSLLTARCFAIGDWDMFQSDHLFAEYHASSRAISGGPVYITDNPGKHNVDLIYKLVANTKHSGYTVLRSSQAPQPTFETVFSNSMDSQSLISLYNIHHELHLENKGSRELATTPVYGVCGFWNTGPREQLAVVTSDLFCFRKLAMVPIVAYVISGPDEGKIVPLEQSHSYPNDDDSGSIKSASSICSSSCSSINSVDISSSMPAVVQPHMDGNMSPEALVARVRSFGSTLVSVSTVQFTGLLSMACLGLIDKFNGTVCILHTEIIQHDQPCHWYATFVAHLSHQSSACGFWIKTHDSSKRKNSSILVGLAPDRVRIDNRILDPKDWNWCLSAGLLTVDMMSVPSNTHRGASTIDKIFIIQIDVIKTKVTV